MPTKVQKEIEKLRSEIEHHNDLYYQQAAPEISDFDFDKLLERLKELEARYPEFITPDSPTQRVGGKADSLLIAENVEVGLGNLSHNFDSMYALNFAETSEALEMEIDLLLGRDFLEGYTLLIDYKNRELTLLK